MKSIDENFEKKTRKKRYQINRQTCLKKENIDNLISKIKKIQSSQIVDDNLVFKKKLNVSSMRNM